MTNLKKHSYFNYFYIALVLLWAPLQGTIMSFDAKGRILFALTIIAFFVNYNKQVFKKIIFSKPIIFWIIWVIYSATNMMSKGFHNEYLSPSFYIITKLVMPLVIMSVCAYEYKKDKNKLIKALLYIFCIYSIIGFFFMAVNSLHTGDGAAGEATLGNKLALNTLFIIFYAGLLYKWGELSAVKFIGFVAFAFAVIIASATRKALGAATILLIFVVLSNMRFTVKSYVSVLFLALTLYVGTNYIMKNTIMGERLSTTEEVGEEYNTSNNAFLNFLGDRAFFYIMGTEIFYEHPISGIGLLNFTEETGTNFRIHSEYIVQLAENGLIGSTLFVLFYVSLISAILKYRKHSILAKTTGNIFLGGVFAILFISLTTWTYESSVYFACLGTVIGATKTDKIKYYKIIEQ